MDGTTNTKPPAISAAAKLRNAHNRIADLGTCANGKTPAHKLFQQALDISVAALDIPADTTDDGHDYRNGNGERAGNWMQTFTGRQFWPIDPRAEDVNIDDIAHALAHTCRFGGHCINFYSVAEHSVYVSLIVPPELAMVALLHDASEAYVLDVPRPLKAFLPGYKEIEHRVWEAVAEHFKLPVEMPQAIKDADNAMLLAEADQIMTVPPAPWSVPGVMASIQIECMRPNDAVGFFLRRFAQLNRLRVEALA